MSKKLNFLGAIQPILKNKKTQEAPRVAGCGTCISEDDARNQLINLYKEEEPVYGRHLKKDNYIGGIFIFDCTVYELIEKTANEESAEIVRKMYDDAIVLTPFIE